LGRNFSIVSRTLIRAKSTRSQPHRRSGRVSCRDRAPVARPIGRHRHLSVAWSPAIYNQVADDFRQWGRSLPESVKPVFSPRPRACLEPPPWPGSCYIAACKSRADRRERCWYRPLATPWVYPYGAGASWPAAYNGGMIGIEW